MDQPRTLRVTNTTAKVPMEMVEIAIPAIS
jgi:hypothetical protein